MPETHLRRILALLEQCLELEPEERRQRARELCADRPDLLATLLDLIERDQALDQARHDSEAGLGALSRVALSERFYQGQIVGAFRIEECIGSGGMGTVYRVCRIDGQVEQQAALKLLSPGHVRQALLSRFSNERRVLASLEHPGICRFLDAGTLDDGQPYVLMELIEGRPLVEFCNRQRLGLRQRVELFLKVTEAVAHAHRRLVIHRDIKSGNILVNGEGQPKLLDFGIAKSLAVEASWEHTQTIERFLTPRSAAPEQLLGKPVGVACDIYALGQLLYELLCGQPPFVFAGLRPTEVERLIVSQPPPPMVQRCLVNDQKQLTSLGCRTHAELRRLVRGDLEIIVVKCLRKTPENRYPSVEQLEADLKRWLADRPIVLRRSERGYRLRKFIARNQLAVSLSSLLAVTLLISGAGLVWQSINMAQERNRALLERDRAQHAVSILQHAFESADPAGVLGADVKARDILQTARAPVLALRESQPELFVSLAAVLADVELSLRLSESAAQLAEWGLESSSRLSTQPDELRQLLLIKALASMDGRDRQGASDALDRVERMDGERQPDWLHARGRWHLIANDPTQALDLLSEAADAHAQLATPLETRLPALWDLAAAYSQLGRHEDSLEVYQEILVLVENEVGSSHSLASLTRFRRLETLARAGQGERAEEEALAIQREVNEWYGAESSMAARLHGSLGLVYLSQGKPGEAASHYRRARAIWQEHFSPDHPDILRATINLAFALNRLEQGASEAEEVYNEALNAIVERRGVDNHTALVVRGLLAQLLAGQGRSIEALQLLVGPEELDLDAAARNRPWRDGFRQVLEVIECSALNLSDRLFRRCKKLESRLAETTESGVGDRS